jgi:hypothetical protein
MKYVLMLVLVLAPYLTALAQGADGGPSSGDAKVPVKADAAVVVSQPAVVSAAPSVEASVAPSVPASAAASVAADDLAGGVVSAAEKTKAAFDGPTVFGIASAISAIVLVLISLLRRFGGFLLKEGQVGKFVLILSALVGGLSTVTPGTQWWQALFMALAPLASVGFHQTVVKPVARKRIVKNG